MTIALRTITVFPVKSTRGSEVPKIAIEPLGLADDRRWMLVDQRGECITARRDHRLLTIEATPTEGGLALSATCSSAPSEDQVVATTPAVQVGRPTGEQIPVTVHGRPLRGIPAAPEASAWLGEVIGRPDARLVFLGEPRPLNPERSRRGDATAFADAYPVTVASLASLRQVQDWVTETALDRGEEPVQLQMRRFRPNLVIDGDLEPFAEDAWRSVRIGEVELEVAKIIDRCALPTIDPDTLSRGKEPTRTLARHRSWDGKTWFGLQLIPRSSGVLRVGETVSVA